MAKQLELYTKVGKLGSQQHDEFEINSIGILKSLKKRNMMQTLEAIKNLPRLQFSCVRQLLSIHEKEFARMLAPAAPAVATPEVFAVQQSNVPNNT